MNPAAYAALWRSHLDRLARQRPPLPGAGLAASAPGGLAARGPKGRTPCGPDRGPSPGASARRYSTDVDVVLA